MASIFSSGPGAKIFKLNYSQLESMPLDYCFTSPEFKLSGFTWLLTVCPKDPISRAGLRTSIILNLRDEPNRPLTGAYSLGLLDKNGTRGVGADINFSNYTKGDFKGFRFFIKGDTLENEYIQEGLLAFYCAVSAEEGVGPLPQGCSCGAIFDFSKLLETGEHADVSFEVDGREFHAHKILLAARSPVFNAMLFGDMREGKAARIDIQDIKPEIFEALLHFVYHHSLTLETTDGLKNLLMAAHMYAMDGLIARCKERLIKSININTFWEFLVFAEEHGFRELRKACLDVAEDPKSFMELVVVRDEGVKAMSEYPWFGTFITDLKELVMSSSLV